MKLQFLMAGSPNDAFWSQAAMYRLSLDQIGGIYGEAGLVLAVGAAEYVPLPERWRPHFDRIHLAWAPAKRYADERDGAQNSVLFETVDHSADVCMICDADTLI